MQPSVFISHGAPLIAIEQDAYTEALRSFGREHADARAIIVISAHWQIPPPVRVTAWRGAPVIHDFGGFPEELYRLDYPAPGDPALAAEIAALLPAAALEPRRGLDHGAWIPLRIGWPEARIPVLQISLPAAAPRALLDLGRALRPLRERDILIAGSGALVHNLRRARLDDRDGAADPWAQAFDAWVAQRLEARDVEALLRYRDLAPHAALAVPTTEHFDPLFCVLGASDENDSLAAIHEGFLYGNLSMRTFAFDPR